MIYDRLERLQEYSKLAPEVWSKIIRFCRACGETVPEEGRHEIIGDLVYASVQNYQPHAQDPEKLEYHRRYADVQFLLLGEESILCGAVEEGAEVQPFDEKKDIGFNRMPQFFNALPLQVGNFALLLPGEGHQPGVGDPEKPVVKVVIKIAQECFL